MGSALSLKPSKFIPRPVAIGGLPKGQRFRLWEGFDNPRGAYGRLLYLSAGSARVRFDKGIEVADFVDGDGNGHYFVSTKTKETDWSLGTLVVPIKEDEEMANQESAALSLRRSKQVSEQAEEEKEDMAKDNGKAKAKAKATKAAPKGDNPCGCGCGARVSRRFLPGHDARFYGQLKRVRDGKMEFGELNKFVQKQVVDIKGVKKALAEHGA